MGPIVKYKCDVWYGFNWKFKRKNFMTQLNWIFESLYMNYWNSAMSENVLCVNITELFSSTLSFFEWEGKTCNVTTIISEIAIIYRKVIQQDEALYHYAAL